MARMLKALGKKVRRIRDYVGLSQPKFAERLGDTLDRVKKIELGVTRPDLEFLIRLRRTFHVSIDRLLDSLWKGK